MLYNSYERKNIILKILPFLQLRTDTDDLILKTPTPFISMFKIDNNTQIITFTITFILKIT